MFYRINYRLLILIFKLFVILIVITFIWFHFKFNNEMIYQKPETKLAEVSNFSKIYTKISEKSLQELRETIDSINRKQVVVNQEVFGPLLANDLVIIIQVHNRVQYLSALIESLERTKGINETLLVFSHDVFDPQINSLITSIKFCKVIQIFFPNSLQLYPNIFPGFSPNDCPRDITKKEALKVECNNANNADTYGHYREGQICQTKHHWWWKSNTIFDRLRITSDHFGYFMFIEEDHYFRPDAIHVWKLINEYRKGNCEKCSVITLGSYSLSSDFSKNGDKMERSQWISSRHNMGFVIDRSVWNQMKKCVKHFCTYDDYNWDWSLQYMSDKCLTSPLITLVVSTPRVYHTGGCGLHHKTSKCNNRQIVNKIETNLKSATNYLFPSKLSLKKVFQRKFIRPKPNGGWSDPRDHYLCLNTTSNYK